MRAPKIPRRGTFTNDLIGAPYGGTVRERASAIMENNNDVNYRQKKKPAQCAGFFFTQTD